MIMQNIITVSTLTYMVKKSLETEFPSIWVEGELVNVKRYPSGHLYFSLKDEKSQVSCVMFAGLNRFLDFAPKDGLQVKVRAKVSLYQERGQFQLLIELMESTGDGALKRAFEILKQKLFAEGLFSEKAKKVIPPFPTHIGVVTSPKGAAIKDILTTLKRRFPCIPVILYPTAVQGSKAAAEICHAIQLANQHAICDVLIVGRGGGSLQDLQAFNEESVARAIYASNIPIVSAVGHEIDITIADFVADVRAATPTAAAELVSPAQDVILKQVHTYQIHLQQAMLAQINNATEKLDWLRKSLKSPQEYLEIHMQKLDTLARRLQLAIAYHLKHTHHTLLNMQHRLWQYHPQYPLVQYETMLKNLFHRLEKSMDIFMHARLTELSHLAELLQTLSPLQILARGYAIVKNKENAVISDAVQLSMDEEIKTYFAKGWSISKIICIGGDAT